MKVKEAANLIGWVSRKLILSDVCENIFGLIVGRVSDFSSDVKLCSKNVIGIYGGVNVPAREEERKLQFVSTESTSLLSRTMCGHGLFRMWLQKLHII